MPSVEDNSASEPIPHTIPEISGNKDMKWGAFKKKVEEEVQDAEKRLKDELYSIYCNGLGDDSGFYAREAEESGLLAVYNAGRLAGVTAAKEMMERILK